MITSADVLLVAPELSVITAQQWNGGGVYPGIIQQAYDELNAAVWGTYLDEAATWLAAHIATMTRRRGLPGQVSSVKAGGVDMSMRVPPGGIRPFSATSYGLEFERLMMNRPGARWDIG